VKQEAQLSLTDLAALPSY